MCETSNKDQTNSKVNAVLTGQIRRMWRFSCAEKTCYMVQSARVNVTPSQLLDSFCFSLHLLPASWISLVCWKTQWAPQQGGLASIRRPPPSITRRLLSQGWVAATAACRTRCTWGPICCTQTAAEDCPTSYWLVSLTGREPLSCLD